ncbi:MAG: group II truncated hemoglobin [Deltaproteobacteria bacterium]|nr:group II truncated hemoglobin [Deltaproteobacteria bacterium]
MTEAIQSPYERLGGDAGVVRLVELFYDRMDTLPEAATIRALHASDLAPMVDKLSVFLIGWMGGPENYTKRFGRVIIPAAHEPFPIGPSERDQWLLCMRRALEDLKIEDDLAEMLIDGFGRMAEMCRTDVTDGASSRR